MPDRVPLRESTPIFICGMPRSGTTLAGALLRTCRVRVFTESNVRHLPDLLRDVHRLMRLSWRGIDPDSFDRRLGRLIYEVCVSLTPEYRMGGDDAIRYATKTPGAELQFASLDELFEERKPFHVYTLREPVAVAESILSMPWVKNHEPEKLLKRFQRSYRRILDLGDRAFVLDVDRATRELEYRHARTSQLARRLGVPVTDETESFLRQWPAVNTRRRGDSREEDARERDAALAAFRELSEKEGLQAQHEEVLQLGGNGMPG